MNDDEFWNIMGRLDASGDTPLAVIEPAVAVLASMDVQHIEAFEELLSEKLFALDTREHARAFYAGELDPDDGNAYISADHFLYARCWVVAHGRDVYEAARSDPRRTPTGATFESAMYITHYAHGRKTGGEWWDYRAKFPKASFSNADGWAPTAATKPGWATSDGVPRFNRRRG